MISAGNCRLIWIILNTIPNALEQVEERLSLITNLKRKYGENEEAILVFAQKARLQLEKITHAEERIAELETQEKS